MNTTLTPKRNETSPSQQNQAGCKMDIPMNFNDAVATAPGQPKLFAPEFYTGFASVEFRQWGINE
jgi:hypothetical protein